MVVSPIKHVGLTSGNGFVQELQFTKKNYSAFLALKSSLKTRADNLYYEYLVGKKLNNYLQYVPSFIETYNIYQYTNYHAWEYSNQNFVINNSKNITLNLKNISKNQQDKIIRDACNHSKYLAITLQYIKYGKNLRSQILEKIFIAHSLKPVLFQIYASLYTLRDIYTHYELHYENILLYKPEPGKYIHYHYQRTQFHLH